MKQEISPQKSPREKLGWNFMMAGFLVVVAAGVVYFFGPRTGNPVYAVIGNYLMAGGLVIYVVGRILRWRGRSERVKQADR
jgi:uncharacterized membrane protein